MSNLYDPDRLSKIGDIMPRFNQHVREGDEIMLGLEGDPMFPEEYKTSRPKGIVTKVKSSDESGESTSIRVRLEGGQNVDIAPHSVDPQRVWEFSDDCFQDVLRRSVKENEPQVDETTYRGSANELEDLRSQMAEMKAAYDSEFKESRNFNNTLIATLNEMASDVCAVNSSAGFCSVFTKEYSKMMSNDSDEKPKSSPFDSDFSSDSESESDF